MLWNIYITFIYYISVCLCQVKFRNSYSIESDFLKTKVVFILYTNTFTGQKKRVVNKFHCINTLCTKIHLDHKCYQKFNVW